MDFDSVFAAAAPPARENTDADVMLAFVAGRPASSARFSTRSYPDGPDPSALFLVDAEEASPNEGRGHGIVAVRWVETGGKWGPCINFSVAPELDSELSRPIGQRCQRAGARIRLTTTWQLGIDEDWASGKRPDLQPVPASENDAR